MTRVMQQLGIASLFVTLAGCSPGGNGNGDGTGELNGAGSQSNGTLPLPCDIATIVQENCQSCHGPVPIGGAPMSLLTDSDFQRNYTAISTPGLMGKTGKLYDLVRIRINGGLGTQKMPQGNPLSPADFSAFDGWLADQAPAGTPCSNSSGGGGSAGGGYGGGGAIGGGGGGAIGGGGGGAVGGGGGGAVGGGGGGAVGGGGGGAVGGGGGGAVGGGGGGAVGGGGGGAVGGGGGGVVGTGGGGGGSVTYDDIVVPTTPDQCANDPSQFQPLVAQNGETCYEFPVHGQSSPTDTSKFSVPTGQSYNQYYYDIPWPANSVATRFGAKFDNVAVLHHWLGFSTTTNEPAGTVQPNVTGTTLGDGANLIGGWAVGGCNVQFGGQMGQKLPDPGSGQIMIQWHNYNSTGSVALDGTAVQFCVVPAAGVPNVGGLTFLGTECLNCLSGNLPAGQVSTVSGTCKNNSGKSLIIKGYNPHMHLLGTNMKSVVQHTNGMMETIFDHPFLFDHQVNYLLPNGYELQAGESITSTCTFDNTTSAAVGFGTSTTQEMCYQFTYSYPYDALNDHVISLIGAANTCW